MGCAAKARVLDVVDVASMMNSGLEKIVREMYIGCDCFDFCEEQVCRLL